MSATAAVVPLHRMIIGVDIEDSTERTNPGRAWLRRAMYDIVEKALWHSGIPDWHRDPLIDRGDGVLALVHPVDQIPKTTLLNAFIPSLAELLARHNERWPVHQFRLRAAIHAGEVHFDGKGPFGEAIDISCRLLDAPELKAETKNSTAQLVLVVSDDLYRSVIRHGYNGIDSRAFAPLVDLTLAGHQYCGWVYNPSRPSPPTSTARHQIDRPAETNGSRREVRNH